MAGMTRYACKNHVHGQLLCFSICIIVDFPLTFFFSILTGLLVLVKYNLND